MPKHTPGEKRSDNNPKGQGSPPEDVENHANLIVEMTAGPDEMAEMMREARKRMNVGPYAKGG